MTLVHAAAGGRAPAGESTEAEEARKRAVEQGLDLFAIVQQRNAVQQLKQANDSNLSHPCHNTYPRLPSFETALLPPSVSAAYQSPELLSFLAACLQISPKQRWTAAQLLEHPFIRAAEHTPKASHSAGAESSSFRGAWSSPSQPPSSPLELPAGSRSTSLSDLTAMCDILCDKYTMCNDRSHALPSECECVVQLDEARLTWLCCQLGLQEADVQDEWTRAQRRWKKAKRMERMEREARQRRAGEQRMRARKPSSVICEFHNGRVVDEYALPSIYFVAFHPVIPRMSAQCHLWCGVAEDTLDGTPGVSMLLAPLVAVNLCV